jgi:hypothetical protein
MQRAYCVVSQLHRYALPLSLCSDGTEYVGVMCFLHGVYRYKLPACDCPSVKKERSVARTLLLPLSLYGPVHHIGCRAPIHLAPTL